MSLMPDEDDIVKMTSSDKLHCVALLRLVVPLNIMFLYTFMSQSLCINFLYTYVTILGLIHLCWVRLGTRRSSETPNTFRLELYISS